MLYYAVAPMDYDMSQLPFKFEECDTRRCLNVTVNNDMTLEKAESFYVHPDFDTRNLLYYISFFGIYYNGEIKIMDNDERKNLYDT